MGGVGPPRAPEAAPGGEGADLRERDEASGSADVGKTLSPNQGASRAVTGGCVRARLVQEGHRGPWGVTAGERVPEGLARTSPVCKASGHPEACHMC